MGFRSLCAAAILLLPGVLGAALPLQQVTEDFGPNPSNVGFFIYVPTNLQPNPPIVVDSHPCHNTAQDAFTETQLATLADTYGYIVIYPNSPNAADMCWDVSSSESLSHDGGGDSLGIVSMVKWTLAKYNGNPNRVFAFGVSSGAMMTNVLLGAYPDVFAAGSAWAGVAFGCYAADGVDVWSDACAAGEIIMTGQQWAAEVFAAFPGYTGFRPKMQCFHGSVDTTLNPQNLIEETKEWTTVLGLPSNPIQVLTDNPMAGWTTSVYGSTFTATLAQGVDHNIQPIMPVVLSWFDLTCTGANCFSRPGGGGSSPGTTLTTTTVPKTTTSSATGSPTSVVTVPEFGQCGGINYTGPTTCAAGSTCVVQNPFFFQCVSTN